MKPLKRDNDPDILDLKIKDELNNLSQIGYNKIISGKFKLFPEYILLNHSFPNLTIDRRPLYDELSRRCEI